MKMAQKKDKKTWQKTSKSFFLRNLGISSFLLWAVL